MLDPAIYTRNWWAVPASLLRKILILETGASHAPTFSKKTTHLLCPSRQGPKTEKALEWGIPVVDMVWLEGLLVPTSNSSMTEDGVSPLVLSNESGEGGVVELRPAPESVPQGALFCLTLPPLAKTHRNSKYRGFWRDRVEPTRNVPIRRQQHSTRVRIPHR